MDVTKMPAPAAAAARTPTAPAAEQGPQSPASAAPIADRADIRPLDIPAALQILLAEVRAAFELQAVAMGERHRRAARQPAASGAARCCRCLSVRCRMKPRACRHGVQLLARVETALQTGLDRGIEAVSAWRDVPCDRGGRGEGNAHLGFLGARR